MALHYKYPTPYFFINQTEISVKFVNLNLQTYQTPLRFAADHSKAVPSVLLAPFQPFVCDVNCLLSLLCQCVIPVSIFSISYDFGG